MDAGTLGNPSAVRAHLRAGAFRDAQRPDGIRPGPLAVTAELQPNKLISQEAAEVAEKCDVLGKTMQLPANHSNPHESKWHDDAANQTVRGDSDRAVVPEPLREFAFIRVIRGSLLHESGLGFPPLPLRSPVKNSAALG